MIVTVGASATTLFATAGDGISSLVATALRSPGQSLGSGAEALPCTGCS